MVRRHLVAYSLATFLLAACALSTPAPPPPILGEITPTETPFPPRLLLPTPLLPPAATASPFPTHQPFTTPPSTVWATAVGATHVPQTVVLAEHLSAPDDLVLAPDGSIYFSDVGDGTIKQLTRDGALHTVLTHLGEPEGMVFLPDGSLLFAEQTTNRLRHYNFQTKQLDTFLQLVNHTNQPGIDNITYDARRQQIIVPDSPHGTLLFIAADGKIVNTLATRLVRPTAVAIGSDDSLIVADEYGNKLVRVNRATGANSPIASLPQPDDVIVNAHGEICANTLVDGAVYCINAVTGQVDWVARGFGAPQGLLLDTDGNLIVTDPLQRRIVKIIF